MIRFKNIFLARAAMTLLVAVLTAATAWAQNSEDLDGYTFATEGEGDSKVYLINNEADLERLAAYVNSGHDCYGMTFKLNASFTMTAEHTPIGEYQNRGFQDPTSWCKFSGNFDGNHQTITNLTVNRPDQSHVGLFGFVLRPNDATINPVVKDVTLVNCHITGKANTGGIAGRLDKAIIQNCHVSGTIAGTVADAYQHGGIVGAAAYLTYITGCTVAGTISTTVSNDRYGGIVGWGTGVHVTSCENAANITGPGKYHGGIIGEGPDSEGYCSQCLNTGIVEGNSYKGGIVGSSTSNLFSNCYYASPCETRALNDVDVSGATRAYPITTGSHIGNITFTSEDPKVITSTLSGISYCKPGDVTLTLTPKLNREAFVSYSCEGGTLTNLDDADGTHTLTINKQAVTIDATTSPYTLFSGYTADGYIIPNNYNTNSSEAYTKLVDGNINTKWCVVCTNSSWKTSSMDFHTATPIIMKGYVLTTGNDVEKNPGRNPKTWKLYGKATSVDEWTEIDARDIVAHPEDSLPKTNKTEKTYQTASNTASYQYFRFEVTSLAGIMSNSDWTLELSELQLFGTEDLLYNSNIAYATIDGLNYQYTGQPIELNYTVKDADGNVLTLVQDYTAALSPNTMQEMGFYTLTLTGTGNYSGTKVATLEVSGTLDGSGTTGDPYLIGSDQDWKTFAYLINNHNSDYGKKSYKLTADIAVSTMVGTSDVNGFGGTFDGAGHTMTLDLTADGDYCAPFRYSCNAASYKRLHIAGTITTSYKYAGGLIGYHKGYNASIDNCWSSVTINSDIAEGSCYHGGFMGQSDGSTSIRNCLFDGKLLGRLQNCGGFVGYSPSWKVLYVYNSLFNPTETGSINTCYTFSYYYSDKIENCYYVQALGDAQHSNAVGSKTSDELQACLGNGWEIKDNKVVPILDIKNVASCTITYTGAFLYTGSEISVPVTVKDMDDNILASSNYTVSISPNPVKDVGIYTLTITGQNGYTGTAIRKIEVLEKFSGAGTETDPYFIASADDWNLLAKHVEKGISASMTAYYKLTADISVTTMVGTETNVFKGKFDGCGHTLTVNYTSSDRFTAPFRFVGACEIKNLHTAGSITINASTVAAYYASGLIGENKVFGVSTIEKCWSSVDISCTGKSVSYAYFGAFIASASSYNILTFTNCLSDGNISVVGTGANCAGFVASNNPNKTVFNNCLMAGTLTLPSGNSYSRTFTRSSSTVEYNNSYYTQNVCASNQGTAVGDKTITELATSLGEGWTVNNSKVVPVVFDVRNLPGCIVLADDATDNSTKLDAEGKDKVMLDGRTLKKNDQWNTICLPFDVTLDESPLAGATAKTLTGASIDGNTVTLTFGDDVETLSAGVPYIIKWESGADIVNPVFTGVTIDKTDNSITKGDVQFKGYYDAFGINATNTNIYYMTAGNTLKHTGVARTLKGCRAYFQFGGNNAARNIVLDFGDATDVTPLMFAEGEEVEGVAWYDLAGRKLDKQPTKKGLYIFNGKKIVIK